MIKLIKNITLLIGVLCLSACSMQGMAEKFTPDLVQQHANETVDAVLRKDSLYFSELQSEGMSEEDFEATLNNMFSYVSGGTEVRRDIVGFNSVVRTAIGNGTYKNYDLTYEIETENGFTAITLFYEQTPQQTDCCQFTRVNVNKYEASPFRRHIAAFALIFKIVASIAVLGVCLFAVFIIRRTRQKKSEQI